MEEELELYLHKSIPLTLAMGIKVLEASLNHVRLFAPIANNKNHKQTAFGGSLHSLATLACWSLLHIRLKNINQIENQLVITKSEIDYLAPVYDDFIAECKFEPSPKWEHFLKMLKTRGKGRIQLESTIHQKEILAVNFKGTFAAIPLESGSSCTS